MMALALAPALALVILTVFAVFALTVLIALFGTPFGWALAIACVIGLSLAAAIVRRFR